jgi:hypothetical protein
MNIATVKTRVTTNINVLAEFSEAGVAFPDYILLTGQTNPKENGVYLVRQDGRLEISPDFIRFGPYFDTFRVTCLSDDTRWHLTVPVGSNFSDLEQEWEQNFDPDEAPEEPEELA